jgi:diguanylate cyclase (GGDEF)-like protein
MDIDNFKQINDRFNHKEGNKALVSFSNILRSLQDGNNLFYRLGGDEFVGLVFEGKEKALKMADTIVKETRKITLPGNNRSLTVSIGILQATKREDPVRKADDLLYKVKRQGKNQYLYAIEN